MADEYSAALGVALRRLETSDRYEAEVRKALSKFDSDVVERVVQYLHGQRFLDDRRTTEHVVDRNEGRSAIGAERLRANLERRGAPEALIDAVVADAAESEPDRARAVLAAKYREPKPEDRAKAGRFLYARGFTEEVIESCLDQFFGSPSEEF